MKEARFAFIDRHLDEHGVSAMCRALGVTRQGCYQWASRPDSAHDLRDRELARLIGDEYDASMGIYGAPKVFMRLRQKGVRTSRKRVAGIMREHGWRGVTRACARRPGGGEKRVAKKDSHDDLVRRDFSADGPNRAWFADIAYVRTRQGWPCLTVAMDVWSRMVVGWSMGPRITAEPADDALKMTIARRRPESGCIHHGAQYVSLLLGKTMKEAGIRPSMGSVSSPWDNAVTESLMGVIKSECVHARTDDSREQAALSLFGYIEAFCNRLRIHSALGWLSPVEFEERHASEGRSKAA